MNRPGGFAGFRPAAIDFLRDLAAHNDVSWFAEHKGEYEADLQRPMRALVAALAPLMLTIDPAFVTSPTRGAVSRIRRDTRFSRDKTPFRINQWICFKRAGPEWITRPAYFLEFGPDGWRCGMGYYAANPATMAAVRAAIAARPRDFLEAMDSAAAAGLDLRGEPYRRPRPPADLPPAVQDWYRLKTAWLERARPLEPAFFDAALADAVAGCWAAAAPLYRLLTPA